MNEVLGVKVAGQVPQQMRHRCVIWGCSGSFFSGHSMFLLNSWSAGTGHRDSGDSGVLDGVGVHDGASFTSAALDLVDSHACSLHQAFCLCVRLA